MPTIKLTDTVIERLTPPESGRAEYYDALIPGLHLRVTSNGVKSFALMTRLRGEQMRLTLGRFGVLFVSEARMRARTALAQVEAGIDPRVERRRIETEKPVTLADVAERFLDAHARRNTSPSTVSADSIARDVVLKSSPSRKSVGGISRFFHSVSIRVSFSNVASSSAPTPPSNGSRPLLDALARSHAG
jgi:Arm domain-containing DNA-binding protein